MIHGSESQEVMRARKERILAHLAESSMSNYKRGLAIPDGPIMFDLASSLGCSGEYLVSLITPTKRKKETIDNKNYINISIKDLIHAFIKKTLNEESSKIFLTFYGTFMIAIYDICAEITKVQSQATQAELKDSKSFLPAISKSEALISLLAKLEDDIHAMLDAIEPSISFLLVERLMHTSLLSTVINGLRGQYIWPGNSEQVVLRLQMLQEPMERAGANEDIISKFFELMQNDYRLKTLTLQGFNSFDTVIIK
ncbi:MAG: hypothetical protein LBC41_07775 [Clostridiales bacterium]|jgi:hypothetical protein|nr:hypothetical protein [Clostridiales bacterium]